jgi:hypothetical protein
MLREAGESQLCLCLLSRDFRRQVLGLGLSSGTKKVADAAPVLKVMRMRRVSFNFSSQARYVHAQGRDVIPILGSLG